MHDEPQQKVYREVTIPETITVQELASRMSERGADVIKTLMRMGVMATINQAIDPDTAELVVTEMGHRPKRVAEGDVETGLAETDDAPETLLPRPPVVTIMGHVDHGKTSLLDALRATDVAAHEAGGITQHIGAYQVTLPSGQKITFLDTPGHEAFTAMRARGAKVTDIVVLVVAADDGVMPQTKEAIAHAKAAGVPMIVAINKMDKAGADPSRVRTELLQDEVQVEQLGGDVQSIEVSATKKTNLDKLEEAILLQAEVLELKANPDRPADGVVVEAQLDPGRGSVATVLVQRGTLKVGDVLVAGAVWGRVRRLVDDRGNAVRERRSGLPGRDPGPRRHAAGGRRVPRRRERGARARDRRLPRPSRPAGPACPRRGRPRHARGDDQGHPRGHRQGAAGADQGRRAGLGGGAGRRAAAAVAPRRWRPAWSTSGVGGISEADLTLAKASGALIIGFNVRANPQAREIAKRDKVDIRYYSIIYKVTEDIQALMVGLLDPTYKETFLGNAQIREVFRITKVGNVAGCMVTEGMVKRGAKVRLLRDNVVIHEGTLKTLKRFKDEVREVQHGFECGMAFENYDDIKVGDVIECFDVEEVQPTLVRRFRADSVARSCTLRATRTGIREEVRGRHVPASLFRTRQDRGPGQRQLRVGEELRHLLAELLERGDMRDPDLRGASITVTAVDVSPDLRNAIAFVMPLGGQDEPRLLAAMRRAAPWFRARVGEQGRPALCARDPLRARPHLRRGRPHRQPAAPARRGARHQGRMTPSMTSRRWPEDGEKVDGWVVLDKPVGLGSTPAVGTGAPPVRRRRRPATAARSIRWPAACCRSRSARRPRPCPSSWTAARNTASRSASAQARSTEDAEGEVTATSDVRARPTRRSAAALPALRRRHRAESRRPSRPSRSTASAPTIWRAPARRSISSRAASSIERLELLGRPDADHADFVVSCGKGTYIRSLGRDLALALGTVGHLSALRRTAAGPFREEAAISLPKLEALGHIPALLGALAPVATALDDIPALALTEAQADRLRQGQPVLLTRDAPPSGALLRAEAGSRLVALVRSDGVALKPVRVFNL